MSKVLLRSNRRIAVFALSIAFLGTIAAMATVWFSQLVWLKIFGGILALLFAGMSYVAWQFMRLPRLAITESELLVYVQTSSSPIRVPLDVVEVFFMGQGAVSGEEPGHPREYKGAVAANVIVRLAEAKKTWQSHSVNQWLAVWAEGYITLRGLWCENIDQELLKAMNHTLMDAKRKQREADRA